MTLSKLTALKSERIAITKQLQPLNALSAQKRSELAKLNSELAGADARLDAAIQHAAHVQGRALIGDATPEEVDAAVKARQAAVAAHAATQTASAGLRTHTAELDGLQAAGHDLGVRLAAIAGEEAAALEGYLRDLADEAAAEYAVTARALETKLAVVLAYQQALARANLDPNLLTGAAWNFCVPGLNSPSAKTAVGWIADIDGARAQQPQQFALIRARIAADGVTVPGLT
jgi:hypothetical protein